MTISLLKLYRTNICLIKNRYAERGYNMKQKKIGNIKTIKYVSHNPFAVRSINSPISKVNVNKKWKRSIPRYDKYKKKGAE